MHLQVVLAFAMLLWWPTQPNRYALLDPAWSTAFLAYWPVLVASAGIALTWWTRRNLTRGGGHRRALTIYHRTLSLLRGALLAGVVFALFFTTLPAQMDAHGLIRQIPGIAQLCLIMPYLFGLALLWWVVYPVERAAQQLFALGEPVSRVRFVVFNLRHQILVVALPLAMLVVAYAITQRYDATLVAALGTPWAGDALLGAFAIVLFLISPAMLRRIWSTAPLPAGPLRDRLVGLCERIHLRVRDILIWRSDGMMVNAAVMGVMPRVRYILLSDALVDSMSDEEIEVVFGHEAGHARRHHIAYFLLFAYVSMLLASAVMEWLIVYHHQPRGWQLSTEAIQIIGLASALPLWGLAFAWISQRFEREADLYGAACARSSAATVSCGAPCTVHDANTSRRPGVCLAGARLFSGALRKVALLNGIPIEEYSWRHASIAVRMRFLTTLAGDPNMAHRFRRTCRGIRIALLVTALTGSLAVTVYVSRHPAYRQQVVQGVIEPLRRIW